MEGSTHLVTSGLLPADAITSFPSTGHRSGVDGNTAGSGAMGRFEANAVSDVTKLQVIRRMIHGENAEKEVIEVVHPATAGKTCRPAPDDKGDVASKRIHPEEVRAGASVVDQISTSTPGDAKILLSENGEPFSICARTPVEFAGMSAVGSAVDGTVVRRDGREHRASRKPGVVVHGQPRMSRGRCFQDANMEIETND